VGVGLLGSPSLRDPRRLQPLSLSSPRRSRQHLLRRGDAMVMMTRSDIAVNG
jgi:hypothetical protein